MFINYMLFIFAYVKLKKSIMENVEILGLTVNLLGERDTDIDLGAVYLKCEGREYILDVCQSVTDDSSGDAEIKCDLEVDKELFEDCAFDLRVSDLNNKKLTAEFYIVTENEIDYMTLFVRSGGENGMTMAIDVVQEDGI